MKKNDTLKDDILSLTVFGIFKMLYSLIYILIRNIQIFIFKSKFFFTMTFQINIVLFNFLGTTFTIYLKVFSHYHNKYNLSQFILAYNIIILINILIKQILFIKNLLNINFILHICD